MKKNLAFAVGLLLSSCVSPYYISQITPTEENTTWAWGRQFVHKTADSVVVKIAYETNDRHQAIFNVEIENYSSQPFLVSPETFWVTRSGPYLPAAEKKPLFAADPETYYLEIARQRSRQEAAEKNATIRQTTEVLTETATAVASIGTSETPEERQYRQLTREENAYNRNLETYELAGKRFSLNECKRFLDQTILRKTTLPPNSVISGEVYFPRHDRAETYELNIPVNGQVLPFYFKQKLTNP